MRHWDFQLATHLKGFRQLFIFLAGIKKQLFSNFFGLIGLLLPVLPGIPFLIIAVVLLATSGDTGSAQPLDGLRLAALRIARLCLISLDMLSKRLFGRLSTVIGQNLEIPFHTQELERPWRPRAGSDGTTGELCHLNGESERVCMSCSL